jgi:hypothetical protein
LWRATRSVGGLLFALSVQRAEFQRWCVHRTRLASSMDATQFGSAMFVFFHRGFTERNLIWQSAHIVFVFLTQSGYSSD